MNASFFRFPLQFLSLSVLILSACDPWGQVEWVRIGEAGRWSIEVPGFFESELQLNDDAPFQHHSPSRDFFVVLRYDSRALLESRQPSYSLEDFLDLSIERLIQVLVDPAVPDAAPTRMEGLPAHVATITGTFEGEPVRYRIAVVQGKEVLYQLLLWVPESKSEELSPHMERVLMSFREES